MSDTPLTPDLVLCMDEDEVRTLGLLGCNAVPIDTPAVREHIVGKKVIALVGRDRLAGDCYALGAEEVWLLLIPPAFLGLRDYLQLPAMPESKDDLVERGATARWQRLLDRAHLLHQEDYPTSPDLNPETGLQEHSQQPFPIEALPGSMRAIVTEGAQAQGVDQAMWGVPLLGCLAGAIGNRFALQVKSGFVVKPILWTVTVCPSGAGKTPPFNTLLRPHRRYDKQLVDASRRAQQQHDAETATKTRRKGSTPILRPPIRMLLADDATIEALAVRLQDNPGGLLLHRDELAGLLDSMNAYRGGRGGDEARWLQLYDGSSLKVDRKTGEAQTIVVESPAVSIVGTVQPGVLRRLFSEERFDSGLASRFLLARPQVRFPDWNEHDISPGAERAYDEVVSRVLRIDGTTTRTLTMSQGARAAWQRFHDSVNNDLRDKHASDDKARAGLVKLRAMALRIATCLAVSEAAESGEPELEQLATVSEPMMKDAIKLSRWFMGQQSILYSHLRIASQEPEDLIELIRERGGRITVRDLMRATRRFRSRHQAEVALNRLVMAGRGNWINETARNGRTVRTFILDDTVDAADADASS